MMEREHYTVIPLGWERTEPHQNPDTGVVSETGWTINKDGIKRERFVDYLPGSWKGQVEVYSRPRASRGQVLLALMRGTAIHFLDQRFTLQTEPQDFVNQTMTIVPSCEATIGFEVDTFFRQADFPKFYFVYQMGRLVSASIEVGPNTEGQIPPADIDPYEFDKISEPEKALRRVAYRENLSNFRDRLRSDEVRNAIYPLDEVNQDVFEDLMEKRPELVNRRGEFRQMVDELLEGSWPTDKIDQFVDIIFSEVASEYDSTVSLDEAMHSPRHLKGLGGLLPRPKLSLSAKELDSNFNYVMNSIIGSFLWRNRELNPDELEASARQRPYGINFYFSSPEELVRYEITQHSFLSPTGLRYYPREFKEGLMGMGEDFRYEDVDVKLINEQDGVLLVCRRKRGELADAMTKVRVPESIDTRKLVRFISDPRSNKWEHLLEIASPASFNQVKP